MKVREILKKYMCRECDGEPCDEPMCESFAFAIEEIEALIPKKKHPVSEKDVIDRNSNYITFGYNRALRDVRKALFGEVKDE